MRIQPLLEQVVKDLTALQHNGAPLFAHVQVATGDPDRRNFQNTPTALVRAASKDSDEENPSLGIRDVIVEVWFKDNSGAGMGKRQQVSDDTKATYNIVADELDESYSYKAGGVYCAAFYSDGLGDLVPEGEGNFVAEATYKVLLG